MYTLCRQRLDKLVRQPLAERGAIVDDCNALGFQHLDGIFTGVITTVVIMAHHAKAGIKPLLSIGMTCGNRCNLGNAGIVINARRRDAGAGIPMADHAGDTFVHQTLRHCNGGTRVGLVVLGKQFKGDRFAVQRRFLGVGVGDRQLSAVFQILADTGGRAGQRAGQTDQNGVGGLRRRGSAKGSQNGGGQGQRLKASYLVHVKLPVRLKVKTVIRPDRLV
ncbi:hypothetical protein D3C79_194040 [compost metagenome]